MKTINDKGMVIVLAVLCLSYFSCKKDNTAKENIMGYNPPVAKAGPDQTIILPEDSVYLDGSASYDPGGKIVGWLWTCTSGPSTYTISDSTIAGPEIKNLTAGYYQFVLKVTDTKGLFSTDTVQVYVIGRQPPQSSFNVFPNAEQVGIFSDPFNPVDLASVVCNNKFYYCDGLHVDRFDPSSNVLTPIGDLSKGRGGIAAVSAENKVFFAGGYIYGGTSTDQGTYISRVDIYNTNTGTWDTSELSIPRIINAGSCTIGNKVFFAGGLISGPNLTSSRVDIYDLSTNSWTYRELSQSGMYMTVIVENKVWFITHGSSHIDVYDAATDSWSTLTLPSPIYSSAPAVIYNNKALELANKIYFTGCQQVKVYDIPTQSWSTISLAESKFCIPAIAANGKIAFMGGMTSWFVYSTAIEIYDPATNSWDTQYMKADLYYESIISYNNYIYSAGGVINQESNNLSSIYRFQL